MESGSDYAKAAADMVIIDNEFSSIVDGIEQGRLVFDNLKKCIAYSLQSKLPQVVPFIFFILFEVPLPLSTFLMICIDLGGNMIPSLSLAYENPEFEIMEQMPRHRKHDKLV